MIYSRVSEKLAAEYGIGQWTSKCTLRPTFTAQVQYYQVQKLILLARNLSYRENEPQCVIKTSKSGHLTDPKLISFMSTTSAAVEFDLTTRPSHNFLPPKSLSICFQLHALVTTN